MQHSALLIIVFRYTHLLAAPAHGQTPASCTNSPGQSGQCDNGGPEKGKLSLLQVKAFKSTEKLADVNLLEEEEDTESATLDPDARDREACFQGAYTCKVGQGASRKDVHLGRILTHSSNTHLGCADHCDQDPSCAGFDYTTTRSASACRTYPRNSPRLGNQHRGGDNRQYCEKQWHLAPAGDNSCDYGSSQLGRACSQPTLGTTPTAAQLETQRQEELRKVEPIRKEIEDAYESSRWAERLTHEQYHLRKMHDALKRFREATAKAEELRKKVVRTLEIEDGAVKAIDGEVSGKMSFCSGSVCHPWKDGLKNGTYVSVPEDSFKGMTAGFYRPYIHFTVSCSSETSGGFEAEIIAPDGKSDSFYVQGDQRVNSDQMQDWHTGQGADWHWSKKSSPFIKFKSGRNSIKFLGREDGISVRTFRFACEGDIREKCAWDLGAGIPSWSWGNEQESHESPNDRSIHGNKLYTD